MKKYERLFLAIPIPKEFEKKLLRFQIQHSELEKIENIRWTPVQNLHVTLFFLGAVDSGVIPDLKKELCEIFSSAKPFELKLEKICFQPAQNPKMIWARFFENENFTKLSRQVADVYQRFQKVSETNFKKQIPHITLARMKNFSGGEFYKKPGREEKILISRAELWRSELQKGGSKYTSIATFHFGLYTFSRNKC